MIHPYCMACLNLCCYGSVCNFATPVVGLAEPDDSHCDQSAEGVSAATRTAAFSTALLLHVKF